MSRAPGFPCDRPEAVWRRDRGRRPVALAVIWTPRFSAPVLHPSQRLRVCLPEPAVVHCGTDGWQRVADVSTGDSGLGLHVADVPTALPREGERVDMSFVRTEARHWEGSDHGVEIRRREGT
jgi:glucoamylase